MNEYNDIKNLAASPVLISAIAYKGNGPDVWVECLYTNGNRGVLNFVAGQYVTSCTYDTTNNNMKCIDASIIGTYPTLKYKGRTLASFAATFSKACLKIQKCTAGETCDVSTPVCTTWADATLPILDIPVNDVIPNPNAPTNLTITPGSGSLRVKWDAVTNVQIFAYYLTISTNVGLVKSGYLTSLERDVLVTGLQNGETYTVTVYAINTYGVAELTGVSTTGIPIATVEESKGGTSSAVWIIGGIAVLGFAYYMTRPKVKIKD